MKVKVTGLLLIAAIIVILLPASAGAQSPGTETSIIVTDVVSGAPLVGKNFTTNLEISIVTGTAGTGVMGAEIWVSFDPAVVSVYDVDGDPNNGTQVEITNDFFDGTLVIVANEVFYDTPTIPHPPECDTQACVHVAVSHIGGSGAITNKTGSVAIITWSALTTGSPGIGIPVVGDGVPPGSVLSDPDGQTIPINDVSVPNITVTHPGTIEGSVTRQGTPTDNGGVKITARGVDGGGYVTATTTSEGFFSLEVPLGGSYVVQAGYPGYLNAYKSSVSVDGAVTAVGATKLLGGEVNNDNCINILDIVSIIGDFSLSGLDPANPHDINDDGTINILDLTIAAGNFSRCGPTAWTP